MELMRARRREAKRENSTEEQFIHQNHNIHNSRRGRYACPFLLAYLGPGCTLRTLMDNHNKAVLTDLQAFDVGSLKERLGALRRFL